MCRPPDLIHRVAGKFTESAATILDGGEPKLEIKTSGEPNDDDFSALNSMFKKSDRHRVKLIPRSSVYGCSDWYPVLSYDRDMEDIETEGT